MINVSRTSGQVGGMTRANPHTESRYSNVDTVGGLTYSSSAVSEASEYNYQDHQSKESTRFVDINNEQIIPQYGQFGSETKIESKEHLWKPAPIMGRDFTTREVNEP